MPYKTLSRRAVLEYLPPNEIWFPLIQETVTALEAAVPKGTKVAVGKNWDGRPFIMVVVDKYTNVPMVRRIIFKGHLIPWFPLRKRRARTAAS